MSFGRPANNLTSFAASPPERGSFPLDHDGECKEHMAAYLKCMSTSKSKSTDCRHLSKNYLGCRMDKGLMDRVEWDALGFQEGVDASAKSKHPINSVESGSTPPTSHSV